jgi:hypothetical protein
MVFCQIIFWLFNNVFYMVANADSLVLLDFAHDILQGKSIAYWNLPRVPYLFPDTAIAILIMAFGWLGPFSLVFISAINFCCLCVLCQAIWMRATLKPAPSLISTQLVIMLSILALGIAFPNAMSNLYWQIFASGAHFLTVIMVTTLFLLTQNQSNQSLSWNRLVLIFVLAFSQAISNSMALLLIAAWWITQPLIRGRTLRHHYFDLLVIPPALVLGTACSFLLPRQELIGSFFSLAQFTNSVLFFGQWALSSPQNYGFLSLLLLSVLAWPFIEKGRLPKRWSDLKLLLAHQLFAPAIAIFLATPLFYQEVGSMRYLAFPALISLLSLGLMIMRITQTWGPTNHLAQKSILGIALMMLLVLTWFLKATPDPTHQAQVSNFDKVGLSVSASNAPQAYACIREAAQQYRLQDGIASYWSARPTRFASEFTYFLAQVNPWRPRSGYFTWGNNAFDFAYRDQEKKQARQYNFIIATNHETDIGLWRAISARASNVVQCPANTLYFFKDQSVLSQYLFPFGNPVDRSPKVSGDDAALSQASFTKATYPTNELFSLVGKVQADSIVASGQAGFLVFGPYVPIGVGKYKLSIYANFSGPTPELGIFDIIAQGGKLTYAKQVMINQGSQKEPLLSVEFEVDKPVNDMEFRIQIYSQIEGYFTHYQLSKISSP